jgi:hypothetical protein
MITRRTAIKLSAGAGLASAWSPTRLFAKLPRSPVSGTAENHSSDTSTQRIALHVRATVLLNQLSSGLDYYGMSRNYVPVLSVKYAGSIATTLAKGGQSLSKALGSLRNDKSNKDKQLDALNQSKNQLDLQLSQIEQDQQQIPGLQKQLLSQIDELVADQESARAEVILAANTLNTSLGGGCDIGEILTIAGMLISFATGIPPEITSLVGALSGALNGTAFGPPDKDADKNPSIFGKNFDVRVKDINIVGSDIGKLMDAYNKAKSAFPPSTQGVDASKFLVQDGDFQALRSQVVASVSKLPDSSAKSAYVAAVNKYLTITQTRNTVLLAYDGLSYRLASSASDKSTAEDKRSRINDSLLTVGGDEVQIAQMLSVIQGLVDSLLRDTHYWVLRYSRAIDFWTLEQQSPPVIESDFDAIVGQIDGLSSRIGDGKEVQGVARGALKEQVIVSLTKEQTATLAESGKVTFLIPINQGNLANKAQVLINTLSIEFREHGAFGVKKVPNVGFTLTHNGYNKFRRLDGSFVEFVSQPRTVRSEPNSTFVQGFSVTPNNEDSSTTAKAMDESDYVGVSPFTQWKVAVDDDAKHRLDRVAELHVTFVGSGLALIPQ